LELNVLIQNILEIMDDAYSYLSNAYGKNHFEIDKPLQIILEYFTNKKQNFNELGNFVGKELYEVSDYVDKKGNPRHIMWSINDERVDSVWLDPSERWAIKKLIKDYGVNKYPYREKNWHKHYAAIYLISDPGIACIITVTNQTAYALYKYADNELKAYIPNLIGESEKIMFGATWFTEIQGGSDLGANTTLANFDGNKWLLKGDTKYFASNAGLADLALVSARPYNAMKGVKGLALFLVPKNDSDGKRNYLIRRLKEKSATISVPTGEIEFNNSHAYLIGEASKGIYYIMEDLMVSRLANSVGALGIARKAYLEAYYYTQKRKSFGKLLIEHSLIQRDLLDMEISIEGALALTFKAIEEFQKSWNDNPPYSTNYNYARLLTHISKNITADLAANITKIAMEIHGGKGFLEEFPIERLHREALITPIWEGTSNIQALDMLEVIEKKGAHIALFEDMDLLVNEIKEGKNESENARAKIKETLSFIANLDNNLTQFYAKDILNLLGHSIAVIILFHLGNKLNLERYITLSKLYYEKFFLGRYKSMKFSLCC